MTLAFVNARLRYLCLQKPENSIGLFTVRQRRQECVNIRASKLVVRVVYCFGARREANMSTPDGDD